MECIFLNAAGQTLFVRDDMESGHWVQQEMNVTADFPFVSSKKIERGMRIAFRDPATDILQVFEIRNVANNEPDHYQQITAEHIAIAELQDEHINTTQITGKTAAQALQTALTGTLWSVGTSTASGTQNADISRGSVWNAVTTIQQNWNVYITPRITISAAGAITGRYLDIAPAGGVWRGVRLSIRKNLLDPIVNYNDEEVLTALYGYGGNVGKPRSGGDDTKRTGGKGWLR
jgi:phage minor structural protein